MLTIDVTSRKIPDNWDDFIDNISLASPFQTTNWAALVGRLRGAKPLFLTAKRGDEPVGQCLLQKEGILSDWIRRSALKPLLLPLVNWKLTTLTWLHGPVASGEDEGCVMRAFLGEIDRIAQEDGSLNISFTLPPASCCRNLDEILTAAGYQSHRHATYLVDLKTDFAGRFHRSVRKNVRKCKSQGVVVEPIREEEYSQYYQLVVDFRKRAGLAGFSYTDFLSHVHLWGDRRELFAARIGDELIAGLGVLKGSELLIEVEAADSLACRERGINANDFLKHEIMNWGQDAGFRCFDLAGVAVEPANEKEENIKRFKSKFGGDYAEFCTYYRDLAKGKMEWLRKGRNLFTRK